MNQCHPYQSLLEDLLAGTITAADGDALQAHCSECNECAEILDLHERLLALGAEIPAPDQDTLDDRRERILEQTMAHRRAAGPAAPERPRFWSDLAQLWQQHPAAAMLATAAVLLVVVFAGRWSVKPSSFDDDLLLQAVQHQAAQQAGLAEYWDAPFSFTNVSVRQRPTGQLALSFDVSRHIDLQTHQNSALAKEVLLHAILEPSSLGSRMGAMDVSAQIEDRRLQDALVLTMHHDPSLTVRLNALSSLARYPYDGQVQDALLTTLSNDQEVQMRLLALDQLGRQHVGLETIRSALGEEALRSDPAILQRVSAMNASSTLSDEF